MFIGLIIGAVSGAAQFVMLARFTKAITGEGLDSKAMLIGVCQFMLPLVVLLGSAFLLPDSLMWAAIGMTVTLSALAVTRFLNTRNRQ